MQLSRRETQLIELFMKNNLTLTGKQLAELAGISTKTVYRTIKRINEISGSTEIVSAEASKGFTLNYEQYLKEYVHGKNSTSESEPIGRRKSIILTLLFKSPNKVKIEELFDKYYVSETLIEKDIYQINQYLAKHGLTLQHEKKRLAIIGSEKKIRKVVGLIIDTNDLLEDGYISQTEKISSYDIDFITSMLEYIEKNLETVLNYPYNINLFSHLCILVKRFREGAVRETNVAELLDEDEKKLIRNNPQVFFVAQQVIDRIEGFIHSKLSEIETFYLFQYLMSSRMKNVNQVAVVEENKSLEITIAFLEEFSNETDQFVNNKENQENLLMHIQPLLYRLKNEIIIQNNMLSDIRVEYQDLFYVIKQIAQKICSQFKLNEIKDDEIGYLVLYFAKYREMSSSKKKVLIMCSSGVGTSELLKVKVKKFFPELEIVDVIAARKFLKNRQDYRDVDFILTTINLSKEVTVPNILVNAVFTKQDVVRVKQIIGEM
jgi:activator of the mannose operon (transcriptional antiterminator)